MITCLLLHVSFNIMLLLILYTQHTHKVGNVGNIKLLITKLLLKSLIIITVCIIPHIMNALLCIYK